MVNNMRLIYAEDCKDLMYVMCAGQDKAFVRAMEQVIADCPTADAVPVVQYNDLRDDFIDYVCSGVPNPAPYCGNATEKCVDARGWCVKNECNGFTPRGERKE